MNDQSKPSKSFWIISAIALIWNALGCFFYLMQQVLSEEVLNTLPEAQREFIETMPAWATSAYAIAVWGGLLGSILLLARKQLAKTVFLISLLGILVQLFHNFVIAKAHEIYGGTSFILPAIVLLVGIYLITFSNTNIKKGILK